MERRSSIKLAVGLGLGFLALIVFLALNPLVTIKAGQRGVVLNWGAVSDEILNEGIHWVTPIKQDVKKIDVKIQKEEKSTSASSKDLQIVTSKVAINYHLDPMGVNRLWQQVGRDYSETIIAPAIEEFVKKTTAKYTAEELITKREEVKDDLRTTLAENLAVNNIIVDDIFITDFSFSAQFDKAIEAKVTAEQSALEAQNKLEQVKFEAEQKIAQAQADAEAIRIQAEAITQQGGREFVNLKAVEKWNGVLPTQMIPGSTVPFIKL